MKKRLRFWYRYLFASHRWHRWLNAQSMLVVVISTAFLSTLYMTAPFSGREDPSRVGSVAGAQNSLAGAAMALQTEAYPVPDSGTPQEEARPASTLPAEYYQNSDQSVGITLAATVLVMIVVFGALMYIPRHEDDF